MILAFLILQLQMVGLRSGHSHVSHLQSSLPLSRLSIYYNLSFWFCSLDAVMQEFSIILLGRPVHATGWEIYRVCVSGAEILKAVLEFC